MTQPGITFDQVDHDTFHVPGGGQLVQSVHGNIEAQTAATQMLLDNNVPLITDGENLGTGVITRERAASSVMIQFHMTLDAATPTTAIIIAVFRDSKCIGSSVAQISGASEPSDFSMVLVDNTGIIGGGSPLIPLELTYTARIGSSDGSTWFVNSTNTGNDLGGTLKSTFVLTELS